MHILQWNCWCFALCWLLFLFLFMFSPQKSLLLLFRSCFLFYLMICCCWCCFSLFLIFSLSPSLSIFISFTHTHTVLYCSYVIFLLLSRFVSHISFRPFLLLLFWAWMIINILSPNVICIKSVWMWQKHKRTLSIFFYCCCLFFVYCHS